MIGYLATLFAFCFLLNTVTFSYTYGGVTRTWFNFDQMVVRAAIDATSESTSTLPSFRKSVAEKLIQTYFTSNLKNYVKEENYVLETYYSGVTGVDCYTTITVRLEAKIGAKANFNHWKAFYIKGGNAK